MNNKILIWISIAIVAVVGVRVGCTALEASAEKHAATERVRRILESMGASGGSREKAVCLWGYGTFNCGGGADGFNTTASAYEAWMAQKGISVIKTFSIGTPTIERKNGGLLGTSAVVVVPVTIDGKDMAMRCIQAETIEWVR